MKPAAPVTSTFNAVLRWRLLEPRVGRAFRQDVLDIENHDVRAAESSNPLWTQRHELTVCDGDDDRIVAAGLRACATIRIPYSCSRLARVGPRIVNVDATAEALELLHDVGHFRVAHVRAVFLEREAEARARATRTAGYCAVESSA